MDGVKLDLGESLMEDLTVKQTLDMIRELRGREDQLQETLVLRAQLQEISEISYNELLQIAKEGIVFLLSWRVGDVVHTEWITRRDELVQRIQKYIQD